MKLKAVVCNFLRRPTLRALTLQLIEEVHLMAISLEALKTEVAANTTVDQSAVALLQGLTAKIQELIDASGNTVDPAELQAIVDKIREDNASLAAAVAANTPVAPNT